MASMKYKKYFCCHNFKLEKSVTQKFTANKANWICRNFRAKFRSQRFTCTVLRKL